MNKCIYLVVWLFVGGSVLFLATGVSAADSIDFFEVPFVRASGSQGLLPGLLEGGAEASSPVAPHQRAALSEDVFAVARGNNQFAVDIYRQLVSGDRADKNLFVSPFSISTALAMTYAGARGQTAQQMAEVLHFDLPEERLHHSFGELLGDLNTQREGYQLNVVNRVFGQQGFPFHQEFLDTVAGDYQSPLESLDFRRDPEVARKHINTWVEEQTNDRIRNLLPAGAVTPGTTMVLTNAIYFDGDWKYQFNKAVTRDELFTTASGAEVRVPMMFQKNDFRYAQLEGFQMLEMPYAGDDLSMVIVLPNELDGLVEIENSLTSELLEASFDRLHSQDVLVQLPKFTFDDSFGLKESLHQLGMVDAFGPGADFTGIANVGGLRIDDVLHKSFIDVSEEGTEAAAATAVTIVTTNVHSSPTPVFRVDHSFMFVLRDTHTGSILFMGRVTQPEALASAAEAVPEPTTAVLCCLVVLGVGFRRSSQLSF